MAEVRLVREDEAAAVYRVDAGGWETGEAVLGPDGVWRLTAGSYCSALLSLKAGAVPIPGSLQGCERVLGVG